MKSVVFLPETLSFGVEDRPIPVPGTGEVLVRLRAAALNRRDYSMLLVEGNRKARSFILGSDGAGTIEQIGPGVMHWQPGDEVVINPLVGCGHCEFCLLGQHSMCQENRVVGGGSFDGTFAEYIKMPASQIARKPEHLSFEQAAALPLALGTAWRTLISRAELKPGETLLIHGIGGGVALFALQIATRMGVRTLVTSGSQDKLKRARELGADVLINYNKENVLTRVLETTNGEGVQVVLDGVGKDTLETSIEAARKGGRIVYFGNNREWDEERPMIYPSPIWFKQLSFLGSSMFTTSEFEAALRFVSQTKLMPVISEVFPLEQIGDAFDRLKHHTQFGKLVLQIGGQAS